MLSTSRRPSEGRCRFHCSQTPMQSRSPVSRPASRFRVPFANSIDHYDPIKVLGADRAVWSEARRRWRKAMVKKSEAPTQSWRFIVSKSKLDDCKVVDGPSADPVDLADGAILIKVDRVSLTANNILYAVLGEEFHYWDLFPAPDGFGVIPAWGFGDVVASRHPGIAVAERVFGYFPMASHATLESADVAQGRFRDGAPHRGGSLQRILADKRRPCIRRPPRRLSHPASPTVPGIVAGLNLPLRERLLRCPGRHHHERLKKDGHGFGVPP